MGKNRFIFDLDNTLLSSDHSYADNYLRKVLDKDDAERFISIVNDLIGEYEKTHTYYDVKEFSEFLTEMSGINITPEIMNGWIASVNDEKPVINEGVIETLKFLKERNKSIVLLTNWFLPAQIARLEKAGLKDYFDDFFGGEKMIKPHPESYLQACGEHPIDDAVMIRDSLANDVYGAMEAGIEAIYYNPHGNENYDSVKVKSIGCMRKIKEMY